MKRVILVAFALGLLAELCWSFPTATIPISHLRAHDSLSVNLAVSGDIVVWGHDPSLTGVAWDIYAYDLAAGREFAVCTATGNQRFPDVSGNIIVWADYRNGPSDIYGYDISTGTEFTICTAPGYQAEPRICGNTVVWIDSREEA